MMLTGEEIKNLAEYAGFTVTWSTNSQDKEDLFDAEYEVYPCPENGVMDDDGKVHLYGPVVSCDGCEGNECIPLSDPIKELDVEPKTEDPCKHNMIYQGHGHNENYYKCSWCGLEEIV